MCESGAVCVAVPAHNSSGSPKPSSDSAESGFGGIAQLITKGPIPCVAQWRWSKLEKACRAVGSMYLSFPAAFNQLSILGRVKDQTLVQLVRQIFANPKFHHQLACVTGLLEWLTSLQGW